MVDGDSLVDILVSDGSLVDVLVNSDSVIASIKDDRSLIEVSDTEEVSITLVDDILGEGVDDNTSKDKYVYNTVYHIKLVTY